MKKTLLALAIAGAAVSAQADVKLSGHVNYTIGDTEDFNGNPDVSVNGANTSMSRFRIVGSKQVGDLTYGTRIEVGLNANAGNANFLQRVNEFTIAGGFGKLSLGQGSEASDGATEADFSGTYLLNGAAYNSWDLDGVINQVDGARDERLRYDSPKLGGAVTLSADYDDKDNIGIALSAGGSMWKAGLFHTSVDANDADQTGASIAIKAGVITAAYQLGTIDETAAGANDDVDYNKFILGYRSGAVSVSFDIATSETDGGLVADADTKGLNFVYRPAKGLELYAGLRESENKLTNVDSDGFLVGGRVRF